VASSWLAALKGKETGQIHGFVRLRSGKEFSLDKIRMWNKLNSYEKGS
jgi:hypothetical protein